MKSLIVSHRKKIVFSFISLLSLVHSATAGNSVDDYIELTLADLLSMEANFA